MLAVHRSPPAPTRLLPWSLPAEPAWASPPRGIGFVPVESPPRTVQEYVMQAARPSAPEPQPVLDAPSHDLREGSEEVDAAAVALRQLDAIARMPEPAPPKALERQNSGNGIISEHFV